MTELIRLAPLYQARRPGEDALLLLSDFLIGRELRIFLTAYEGMKSFNTPVNGFQFKKYDRIYFPAGFYMQ